MHNPPNPKYSRPAIWQNPPAELKNAKKTATTSIRSAYPETKRKNWKMNIVNFRHIWVRNQIFKTENTDFENTYTYNTIIVCSYKPVWDIL